MWSEGTIGIPDAADKNKYTACHYWVKHYDEPSEIYGLNKGKISKLMIKINGTVAANYDADYAVSFIESLRHTKGQWYREALRTHRLAGTDRPGCVRRSETQRLPAVQHRLCGNPEKMGKSELAAAIALLLTCGDGEERAEVYGCAADHNQASIVFNVAADMVRMCPALSKRVKILDSKSASSISRPAASIRCSRRMWRISTASILTA
jgi:hypothetical protein